MRALGLEDLAVGDVVVVDVPSTVAWCCDPEVEVTPSSACAAGEVGPSRLTRGRTASALLALVAIECGTVGGALMAGMVAVPPILPAYVAVCQMVDRLDVGSVDESLSCPFLMGMTVRGSSASVGVPANRTRRVVAVQGDSVRRVMAELDRFPSRWWESMSICSVAASGERGGSDSALLPGLPM